ncbi:RCC1 domain-containing protein [Bdellovibrio bacteriovorus]
MTGSHLHIFKSVLLLLALQLLAGCTLDITLFKNDQASLLGPSTIDLSNKVADLPTSVPESYPYYGEMDLFGIPSGATLSLADNTCTGLSIAQDGVLSGDLDLLDGETCEYKIQANYESITALSPAVSLTIGPSLTMSFAQTNYVLKSSEAAQTATLNLSAAAPFDTYVKYSSYSSTGTPVSLEDLNPEGRIFIPAGATSVAVSLGITAGMNISNKSAQVLQINNGMSLLKAALKFSVIPADPAVAKSYDVIEAGAKHICAISSGKLYCWGNNDYGQLGLGNSTSTTIPTRVGTSTTWQSLALGGEHTCGINTGELYCWGRDSSQQLGNGAGNTPSTVPQKVGSSNTWQSISAGTFFTCGINAGELYCWGFNQFYQLGLGNIITQDVPTKVGASSTWTSIGVGSSHGCGIDAGKLFCWGRDNRGQQGNGAPTANVTTPAQIGASTTWEEVKGGGDHTCGINAGQLYCWGDDYYAQQGNGAGEVNTTTPQIIDAGTDWEKLTSRQNYSCAIANGELYCWGAIFFFGQVESVTQVGTSDQWSDITTGDYFACGLDAGKVYCWTTDDDTGRRDLGLYSPDEIGLLSSPQAVGDATSWSFITGGLGFACGIKDGGLYCWGDNPDGQLGINDPALVKKYSPQRVGNGTSWSDVAGGVFATCGIKSGSLYCWGGDMNGELGNGPGSTATLLVPTKVGTSSNWTEIAAGPVSFCGIDGGKLFCWGDNVDTPQQVGASSTWQTLGMGAWHTCGIDGGKLFCWGTGGDGQLGDGLAQDSATPVQVGTSTAWTAIGAGIGHSCGLNSGKLFCWGDDSAGAVGNGAASANVLIPEQIGVSTSWETLSVSALSEHSCAINSGKLYCWGSNPVGQVGNGTYDDVDAPVQIGSSENWTKLGNGDYHSCGINNGRLHCWGDNWYGQLAVPNPTPPVGADYSSPILVGTVQE